ncbi:MAG: DsbA family protein [Blastocatellales bacterium]
MPVIIQAFSDYVCPYCYLGQFAVGRAAAVTGAEIVWRAYQLQDPDSPKSELGEERKTFGWENFVFPMAEALGVEIRQPSKSPMTRSAHEAAAWARKAGRFDQFHQRLFKALFLDDEDISELAVLKRIAWQAGLNPDELERVLIQRQMADEVEEDLLIARTYGVKIVPTFIIGGHLFSGVQEEAVLIKAIELARDGKLEAETRKLPHLPVNITRR